MNSTLIRKHGLLVVGTLLAALSLVGCGTGGGSTTGSPTPKSSATTPVQVTVTDAPSDRILSFEITINSISLTAQDGSTVSVLSSPTEIELTHLVGTTQPLTLTSVPQGTYTSASFTVSDPSITFVNAMGVTVTRQMPDYDATVTIPFSPALTIGTQALSLNFDFNLATSVTLDPVAGTITINPKVLLTHQNISPSEGEKPDSGEVEDFAGTVTSTTATTLTVSGRMNSFSLTCTVDANTKFDGVSGLSGLQNGDIVQVNAKSQADGSLVCTDVEAVDDTPDGMEARGIVSNLSGSSPNLQFDLIVEEANGDKASSSMAGSTITVTTSSETAFAINWNGVDPSALGFTPQFDSTTIFNGQNVAADTDSGLGSGTTTSSGTQTTGTLAAKKVVLKAQPFSGTVSGLSTSGGLTTFTLTLASDSAMASLLGTSSIQVMLPATAELDVQPVNGSVVRVRGFLFNDQGTFKLVARRTVAP